MNQACYFFRALRFSVQTLFLSNLALGGNLLAQDTASPSQEEGMEGRHRTLQQYFEVSKKLHEKPELADLRSKAEEARKRYQDALEIAFKEENSELYAKYHALRQTSFSRPKERQQSLENGSPAGQNSQSAYSQLSDADKKRLDTARREAMKVPAVNEARLKRNQATNEQERAKAAATYREELHKAMLAADEDLEDILKRIQK